MVQIKINVKPGAKIPDYQSSGAAGADIYAFLEEQIIISPGQITLISTGIFIELPQGYEAQIRPRSGLALNYGITLLNTPGTIDSDYRGEIKVIMINHGKDNFIVKNGMRIAQMVFNKIHRGEFIETAELKSTSRNEGGFGHTGV